MALPRQALVGILGAVLILVTFVAMHGVGKGGSSSSSKSAPGHASKPAPVKRAPAPVARGAQAKHAAAPAKPAPAARKAHSVKVHVPAGQEAGAAVGLPLRVARAFSKKQVVVLFFGGAGSDDAQTADSVRALRASSRSGVAVFMDKLSNLADYRRVVEGLDVSQAPSIVIVDRDRNARLLEGFIDAGSLRQDVADVAR